MEWISTKKKHPEFDKSVLCYCEIYGRFVGSYTQIGATGHGQWSGPHGIGILPPTHWVPLPKPPGQECLDLPARLRELIAKYEAENVFPNSCLAWKIAGLKEALEIVTNGGD